MRSGAPRHQEIWSFIETSLVEDLQAWKAASHCLYQNAPPAPTSSPFLPSSSSFLFSLFLPPSPSSLSPPFSLLPSPFSFLPLLLFALC